VESVLEEVLLNVNVYVIISFIFVNFKINELKSKK